MIFMADTTPTVYNGAAFFYIKYLFSYWPSSCARQLRPRNILVATHYATECN